MKNVILENTDSVNQLLDNLGLPNPEVMHWQMTQSARIGLHDSKRLIKKKIRKYLVNPHNCAWIRNPVMIGNEHHVSIQASSMHYSYPRKNQGPYKEIEMGFPSFKLSKEFRNQHKGKGPFNYLDLKEVYAEIHKALPKIRKGVKPIEY